MLVSTLDQRPHTPRQRKRVIRELVEQGVTRPSDVAAELAQRGVVNRRGVPFSLSTIRNDIRENPEPVQEMIGRTVNTLPLWKWKITKSYDKTQVDYGFWDKLRRGKADQFALGALFCRPLTEIVASSVLGDGFGVTLSDTVQASQARVEYTNQMLERFISHQHRALTMMAVDLFALGDQYPVVNPDGSMSYISPELVEITPGELDYRQVEKLTVTSRLDAGTLTDEFTPTTRVITLKKGASTSSRTFSNLIGRMPIVHFPNDRGTNEIYGRPIYEALYRLFSRYDDLIEKAIDGVELMGNPMPVFEGMENITETINANATQDTDTYTDKDGNTETRQLLRWDTLGALWIGKGGQFNFKSPAAGFTTDVRNMLKMLFLLMLDYTRVPEAVWGGAISSSKASADAQMPPFYQYIQGRRVMLEGDGADDDLGFMPRNGLYALIDVWLRTRALVDPQIVVGPTKIKWPELNEANWEVLLKWTSYLRGMGLLDKETTLNLFGQVDDPVSVIEKADEEADEAHQKAMEQQQAEGDFNTRLRDAQQRADDEAQQNQNQEPIAA